MVTALRVLLLLSCGILHAAAFSLSHASSLHELMSRNGPHCTAARTSSCHVSMIQMNAEEEVTGRRKAALLLAGAVTSLVLPQAAPAQGLAGLRKRITGEADGEERSSVRRKKDAQFNLCETYQCIDPNENTMGGALARVQLGEISILAPTKWTKGEAGGDVLASWSDGTGSALKVEKQTVEASGLKWKRLAPGTIPAMAKSIIDLDIAQTGLKLARMKGEGVENTGAKARYLKNDQTVMYTIGLRSPTEIEAVDVLLGDEFIYKVTVSAPIDQWQTVKAFLSEILSSPSLPSKTPAPAA